MTFWASSELKLTSPLAPAEAERRLGAALAAAAKRRRHAVSGRLYGGRLKAWVRPLSYRADLHPRLVAKITASAHGSTLEGLIAPRRWALVTIALFVAFLFGVSLFCLAAVHDPALAAHAGDRREGVVVFPLAGLGAILYTALLLWFARNDHAILTAFVREAIEA